MYPVKLKNGNCLDIGEGRGGDAAELLQFINIAAAESDSLCMGEGQFPATVRQMADMLAGQAARRGAVVLCGKVQGRVVAVAAIFVPSPPRLAHTGEIALLVGSGLWNNGVGTAMMMALLDVARQAESLRLLHLTVRADNEPAISLYRRLGFEEAGRLPGYLCIGGEYHDILLMCLEKEKYPGGGKAPQLTVYINPEKNYPKMQRPKPHKPRF